MWNPWIISTSTSAIWHISCNPYYYVYYSYCKRLGTLNRLTMSGQEPFLLRRTSITVFSFLEEESNLVKNYYINKTRLQLITYDLEMLNLNPTRRNLLNRCGLGALIFFKWTLCFCKSTQKLLWHWWAAFCQHKIQHFQWLIWDASQVSWLIYTIF